MRAAFAATLALGGGTAIAQAPRELQRERAEHARFLMADPLSPRRAVMRRPVGSGLSLGPADADVPLGLSDRWTARGDGGVVVVRGPDGTERRLKPGGVMPLPGHTLVAYASATGPMLTLYRAAEAPMPAPLWYDYDPALVFTVSRVAPPRAAALRIAAPDGRDEDAAEAGTVRLSLGGSEVTLTVRLYGDADDSEQALLIYFRDGTNGDGSYPAGRYVQLRPIGGDRFLLDFNRAFNPWCAYSSAFPCPAPWAGNSIPAPIKAGERYVPAKAPA